MNLKDSKIWFMNMGVQSNGVMYLPVTGTGFERRWTSMTPVRDDSDEARQKKLK
jgi:hypothetical protein